MRPAFPAAIPWETERQRPASLALRGGRGAPFPSRGRLRGLFHAEPSHFTVPTTLEQRSDEEDTLALRGNKHKIKKHMGWKTHFTGAPQEGSQPAVSILSDVFVRKLTNRFRFERGDRYFSSN
ncbi:uncharacterized protein LOC143819289 [Paroedura picta]|uniref:uncharacterized protein LOC143819289 n=1 Tax=Paroedura picta TaxID=143630 RepID=UPI004055BC58